MEEVPQLTLQSMAKTIQFLNEPELQKHPEVSSYMESAKEQMINKLNQLSLHLLQPRINKNRNLERILSTIQCYKCRKMRHYLRECQNLPALLIKENVGSSIRRFFCKRKGQSSSTFN